MQHFINHPVSLSEVDLVTPTSTAKYPLGFQITVGEKANISSETASTASKRFVYVKASAALTAKNVYLIQPSGTAGGEVGTATPATSSVAMGCGVANVAFTSGYFGFLQIEGDTQITSAGATTAGNTGKLANGVTTVTDEAGTAVTAKTIGYIKNTLGAAGTANVYLINQKVTV